MDASARISLYNTLFYVSLGVAALGLILALFFFFYFDIPTVYAMMTGKAKKATIRKMEEQNAKTGNLRMSPTGRTAKSDKTRQAEVTPPPRAPRPVQPPAREAQPPRTQEVRPETSVLNTRTAETVVLQATAPETTVLQNGVPVEPDYGKTEMLRPEAVSFPFRMTETTLVIHTDEIIE